MTTTIRPAYDTQYVLPITLASLASSASLISGRSSSAVNNQTNRWGDAHLAARFAVGTTPTANTFIQIWLWGILNDDPVYPTGFDGTNKVVALASAGVRDASLLLAAQVLVDSTASGRVYDVAPFSVAEVFGGRLPSIFGGWVTQNTGVALDGSAINHGIWLMPTWDELVTV